MAKEWAYEVPATSVVGQVFCSTYPLDLTVKRKNGFLKSRYKVLDSNGKLLLQVDGNRCCFKKKRVMLDPAGLPIVTMRLKACSFHKKWTVHGGDISSSGGSNVPLFSVQNTCALQCKPQRDVFLASNFINKGQRDFHVRCSCDCKSFKVYKDDTIIAEVDYDFTCGECWMAKETFRVRVNPGVDYAFITSLIVINRENLK